MNDTFNLRRMGLYAARQYAFNYRKYLAVAATLAVGLVLILLLFTRHEPEPGPAQLMTMTIYNLLCVVAGVMLVAADMRPLRGGRTGAVEGTLPCSTFERWLYVVLNDSVLFTLISMAVYALVMGGYGLVSGCGIQFAGPTAGAWIVLPVMFQGFMFYAATTRIRNLGVAFLLVTVVALPLLLLPLLLPTLISLNWDFTLYPYCDGISGHAEAGGTIVRYTTEPVFHRHYNAAEITGPDSSLVALVMYAAGYFKLRDRQNA